MTNAINTPRYNLDTCTMLCEFNASVWTARKLDKSTTDEVVSNKNAASKDAARVNKHLLAGRDELETVSKMVGRARTYVYDNTLPWSDSGLRLLPVVNFEKFATKMDAFESEFEMLVQDFVNIYPTLITAQAMALGDMFRRDDYPTQNEIMRKFAFRVNYMPVPTSGDIRVDVGNAARKEMADRLDALLAERVEAGVADFRKRIGDHLRRMSDRLTTDYIAGEAKPRKFHDTLVEGAIELCDMAKAMNITDDPAIRVASESLEKMLLGVTPKDLKADEGLRQDTKDKVDELLGKFSF